MRQCCRKDKERENISALEVLPDLLTELDKMTPPQRLLALVKASAAAAAASCACNQHSSAWREDQADCAACLHACLLSWLQGVLAANIFDWGAKACVDLYQNATILEMYREVHATLYR